MLASFKFYEPVGPLAYLLMTPEGERILGLYRSVADNSFVLIFPLEGKEHVLHPSKEQLDSLMQTKCTLADIMYNQGKSNLTDINGNKPGLFSRIRVYKYLTEELAGKLSKITSAVLYPNFYYIYSEYCFNESEKKE